MIIFGNQRVNSSPYSLTLVRQNSNRNRTIKQQADETDRMKKTNKMTYAPSKDSDQPVLLLSLITVFAVCLTVGFIRLQLIFHGNFGEPEDKENQQNDLCGRQRFRSAQSDHSLCCLSECWFYPAVAHISGIFSGI